MLQKKILFKIRENITPRGDGNIQLLSYYYFKYMLIRENITPRGDGNSKQVI